MNSDGVKMKDRYTFELKTMSDLKKYLGKDLKTYVKEAEYVVKPASSVSRTVGKNVTKPACK